MPKIFVNFEDSPVGDFPTGFSGLVNTGDFKVVEDGAASNGKALQVAPKNGHSQVIELDGLQPSGIIEAVMRVKRVSNDTTDFGMGFGPKGTTDRVQTTFHNVDELRIGHVEPGFKSLVEGFPFTPPVEVYHYYKFQWVVSDAHLLRVKAWTDIEPDEWLSLSTPLETFGFSEGVLKIQGYRQEGFYVDWVGVGTDGETAPTKPTNLAEPSKPFNFSVRGGVESSPTQTNTI